MSTSESAGGASFVDAMIALTVLGLMAAVAIPQMREAEPGQRAALVAERLSELRGAVEGYWAEHDDGFPGRDGVDALLDQLTHRSTSEGLIGTREGACHGPYLSDEHFPHNPLTHSATVRIVHEMPGRPVGTEAWIYDVTSGVVRCNVRGTDADGRRWFDY
ncbi:MAG: hypothetical protein H6825_05825 [Planctomycetes bacterium]|nr:hypothetical protein [Planctomycetota bacterium]